MLQAVNYSDSGFFHAAVFLYRLFIVKCNNINLFSKILIPFQKILLTEGF